MLFQRLPRVPSKAQLTWRIVRLSLDDSGRFWAATAVKGAQVATVRLPPLLETWTEDAWLAQIEAAFAEASYNPIGSDIPCLEGLESPCCEPKTTL